jgi:hypothetical protein
MTRMTRISRCDGSSRIDDTPDFTNGRWEIRDAAYVRYGRKAPNCTKPRIFGAFINAKGDELIPADKRNRAKDIHEFGWS